MHADIILLPWVVFIIFWGVGAFMEQMAERQKHSVIFKIATGIFGAVVLSAFMLLYIFFFYYSNISFFGSVLYSQTIISKAVGFIIAIAGLALALWARLVLGMNWSRDPLLVRSNTLITTGPYKLVRHPVYLGVTAMFLGTAIYLGLLGGFIGFTVGFIMVFWKSRLEDQELIKHFPNDYPEYRKRTKSYIPFIY